MIGSILSRAVGLAALTVAMLAADLPAVAQSAADWDERLGEI